RLTSGGVYPRRSSNGWNSHSIRKRTDETPEPAFGTEVHRRRSGWQNPPLTDAQGILALRTLKAAHTRKPQHGLQPSLAATRKRLFFRYVFEVKVAAVNQRLALARRALISVRVHRGDRPLIPVNRRESFVDVQGARFALSVKPVPVEQ